MGIKPSPMGINQNEREKQRLKQSQSIKIHILYSYRKFVNLVSVHTYERFMFEVTACNEYDRGTS